MKSGNLSRRKFVAGVLAAAPGAMILDAVAPAAAKSGSRSETAFEVRKDAASFQKKRPLAAMTANADEDSVPNRIACYAKGLPQNEYGEVQPAAYDALLEALRSGKHADFERIPRGGGRKLNNPESAFAFHLEGGDPHSFAIPPAPSISSETAARETTELYCQALCRDISFQSYGNSSTMRWAANLLGATPAQVFRGPTKADLTGPYVSQFLLKPIPLGSGRMDQRYTVPVAGSDFMTSFNEWRQIQLGMPPWLEATYDPTLRYIRNGRDLAEWVHYDFPYQAFLNAALILINSGPHSLLNCNPFKSDSSPYRYSTIQEGFVTFGQAEITDLLGTVTTAALKAAYCQKWLVHRRLRPEALGGLIHQTRTGNRNYPVHSALLHSEAVEAVKSKTGSYLLPQAYPEGSPLHPSYPAGHAAIAGACSVVLKATFDGTMLFPACMEPTGDGLSLVPCANYSPTVADEVNKLAFNVIAGRLWAGIHYRSDAEAGLRLGEDVGISVLQDIARTYSEDFKGFSFTRFSGAPVHITPRGELIEG